MFGFLNGAGKLKTTFNMPNAYQRKYFWLLLYRPHIPFPLSTLKSIDNNKNTSKCVTTTTTTTTINDFVVLYVCGTFGIERHFDDFHVFTWILVVYASILTWNPSNSYSKISLLFNGHTVWEMSLLTSMARHIVLTLSGCSSVLVNTIV